ncbi:MAG TPA: hypothetical protein RMH85_11245 [Polyangiaceae bacterium LLY-WYZ-15_(1-7)]|nr:hypothetical protein [Sandaracinus sp.]HJK91488.1 hypothetical protein [Polyangiaceae bacterium LLY-WYZ-15_(1-7)]MBJ72033.1 hypothetical protein [Sandaracinus sp.]HJL05925.1 hypothetical protein [Polyangiaceae bacterium LLY-WYZ-15_(1-7)]HJL09070.1 hypothetical protein [Polyangiaceae bacterium LLY-WYZ-15_(1-7)]
MAGDRSADLARWLGVATVALVGGGMILPYSHAAQRGDAMRMAMYLVGQLTLVFAFAFVVPDGRWPRIARRSRPEGPFRGGVAQRSGVGRAPLAVHAQLAAALAGAVVAGGFLLWAPTRILGGGELPSAAELLLGVWSLAGLRSTGEVWRGARRAGLPRFGFVDGLAVAFFGLVALPMASLDRVLMGFAVAGCAAALALPWLRRRVERHEGA